MGALDTELGIDENALRIALTQQAEYLTRFLGARIPQRFQSLIAVEDVFQEVCAAAFRSRATFKYDRPDALQRWLTSIAQNQLLTMLKAAACRKRGGNERFIDAAARSRSYVDLCALVASPDRTPSGHASLHEASHALQVAMAGLPPDQRELIRLRFIDGKSLEEIADQTGRTKSSVRGLLFRGLQELKSCLGDPTNYLSDVFPRKPVPGHASK